VFVQNLLGDAEDMSDKKCPFIWELAYDEPSARPEVSFGFRHQFWVFSLPNILARGFSKADSLHEHFLSTYRSSIPLMPSIGCKRSPLVHSSIPFKQFIFTLSHAPVLTYRQVHRALLYSVTGTLRLPADKKSAEFSKTNWGDHSLITPRGEKVIKRAMVFLKRISTLKDPQWDDIFNKVLVFQATLGKQRATVKEVEMRDSELVGDVESKSDDDDLLDPRYDAVPQAVEEEL
jgi:hypothetical protein